MSKRNKEAPNRRRTILVGSAALIGAVVLATLAITVLRDDDGVSSGAVSSNAAGAGSRANVIWLMTDDQEVASLRMMPKTRRLLVDQGVRFSDALTAWPLCCPSRVTLQTGQYPHNHGVLENRPPLGGFGRLKVDSTLPVWLQDAGYATVQVGEYINDYTGKDDVPPGWSKWLGMTEPSNRYFKAVLNEDGENRRYSKNDRDYSTDLFTRKATEFIEGRPADAKPFFLSVGYVAPHVGSIGVTKDERCAEKGPEPAPRHVGAFPNAEYPRTPAFNEEDVSDKPGPIRELERFDDAVLRERADRYQCRLASLLAVDDSVAEIVRSLRSTGELDNTYIFFTSDNGYLQGEHRIEGGKSVLYENSIHVPLLVRGPSIPAGKVSGSSVSNVDWAPTILDIAGAKADLPLDGISFLPIAENPSEESLRALLIESARERYSGVHTPRYVYAEYYGGGEYADDDVEMYDLRRDPYELENVASDPAYEEVRGDLRSVLDRLRDCKGKGCDGSARVQLEVTRDGDEAQPCSSLALARITGPDAAAIESVRFRAPGVSVSADGDEAEVEVPEQETQVRAAVELLDGRLTHLETTLAGC